MIKRILSVTLLAFVFVGCKYTVDQTDIMKGTKFCKDKLGLKYIIIHTKLNNTIECLDGTIVEITKVKLKDNK